MRTNAVYAPDDTGLNPSYWVPMWMGDNQPAAGPDMGDMDANGNPDWLDQFHYARDIAGTLAWWGGGAFIADGTVRAFAAQWCVSAGEGYAPLDSDMDGIPDSTDPYPSDPDNNSYWWPGGTVVFNGNSYLLRARWFVGSGAASTMSGVPDCMASLEWRHLHD